MSATENNVVNDPNDSIENNVVTDLDADTGDIEDTNRIDFSAIESRIDSLETILEKIQGGITAIRDAQSIMVNSGAVIREGSDSSDNDDSGSPEFIPLEELDFSI